MGCRKVEGEILGLRAPLTSLTITFPSIHTPFLNFGALKLVYHPSLPACTPHVCLAQSSVPRATPMPSPWEPLGTCLLIEQTMESLPSDQGSVSSLHTGTLRKLKRPEGTESCQLLARCFSPTVRATGWGYLFNLMLRTLEGQLRAPGHKGFKGSQGWGWGM